MGVRRGRRGCWFTHRLADSTPVAQHRSSLVGVMSHGAHSDEARYHTSRTMYFQNAGPVTTCQLEDRRKSRHAEDHDLS